MCTNHAHCTLHSRKPKSIRSFHSKSLYTESLILQKKFNYSSVYHLCTLQHLTVTLQGTHQENTRIRFRIANQYIQNQAVTKKMQLLTRTSDQHRSTKKPQKLSVQFCFAKMLIWIQHNKKILDLVAKLDTHNPKNPTKTKGECIIPQKKSSCVKKMLSKCITKF